VVAVVDQQLIERSAVERHAELVAHLAAGAASMCMALWQIRAGETYVADGFKSFAAFLRSIGMSERNGRLYANSGPVFEELRKTGHDRLVGHVDVLRPVAFLLNPKKQDEAMQRRIIERQAHIVRTAAAVAKRGQEPFGEAVVSRVAESNFGIRPRVKYLADRKAKREAEKGAPAAADLRSGMRVRLDAAWSEVVSVLNEHALFLGYARTNGYGLVQELGHPRDWSPAFVQALQIMKDAEDA
jgi:hypothetical protein